MRKGAITDKGCILTEQDDYVALAPSIWIYGVWPTFASLNLHLIRELFSTPPDERFARPFTCSGSVATHPAPFCSTKAFDPLHV